MTVRSVTCGPRDGSGRRGRGLARVDPLDIAIGNAGIVESAPFLEITEGQWHPPRRNLTGCLTWTISRTAHGGAWEAGPHRLTVRGYKRCPAGDHSVSVSKPESGCGAADGAGVAGHGILSM